MADDGCYPEWSRSERRRARKIHMCSECGRVISPGEHYLYAAGKTEGDLWFAKVCDHCGVACDWLLKNCGGFLFHAVLEDFVNHAQGSLPMLRIVVGARRRWASMADGSRLLPIPGYPPNMHA